MFYLVSTNISHLHLILFGDSLPQPEITSHNKGVSEFYLLYQTPDTSLQSLREVVEFYYDLDIFKPQLTVEEAKDLTNEMFALLTVTHEIFSENGWFDIKNMNRCVLGVLVGKDETNI